MNQFRYTDAPQREQKLSLSWHMLTPRDNHHGAPDENDEGFWPSQDRDSPGWIGDNPTRSYETQMRSARARMAAWRADKWHYVGVIAKLVIHIPLGGRSFRVMEIESAGTWGIESTSGKYLRDVFEEQKAELRDELETFAKALLSGDCVEESES